MAAVMYKKSHLEDMLLSTFYKKEVFSRAELWDFIHGLDPTIKDHQLTYIIVDLKKRGKLRDVGKGVYTIGDKVEFHPPTDKMMTALAEHLKKVISQEQPYDIWSTEWLNEFLELQATSIMYIVEVDKEDLERVFYELRDHYSFVFANPDRAVTETYIPGLAEAVIVRPLISRAPLDTNRLITFPTLEKILVDLYCDADFFFAYQGSQLVKIFQAAILKYPINFSRLFNYAKRRHRQQDLQAYLLKHTDTKTAINSTKK